MKRVVFKFKDGTHINIEADYLQRDEEFITAWNGDQIIAVVRCEFLAMVYLSEKGNKIERSENGTN